MTTFLFYLFATILLFAGTMVISSRNPVHSAMFLVLAFFTSAGIWMLLEAEFLAITLVLVYVGAVMVLFLFVIMMLDINFDTLRQGFVRNLPVGLTVAILMAIEMIVVVGSKFFESDRYVAHTHDAEYNNTAELGKVLYTEYMYAFEIAAVILVLAIVAAIALTMRRRPASEVLRQDPSKQVLAKKADRLRVVKMAAEDKQ